MTENAPTVMGLQGVLSEDLQKVTMTLLMDGGPLGHIIMEAPEVELLIHQMAAFRANMAEAVPMDIEPRARMVATDDPAWKAKIPSNAPKPGVVLALRHPGLGWLTHLLPKGEAHKLGQSLLALSQQL
jgi:hypothetical protein